MDIQERIDNLAHISKCIKVYNRVEQFILEHGKRTDNVIDFDIEALSQKDCFNLVDELIHLVVEE